MIWQTWRQHRAEASLAAVVVIALAAAMIVVGTIARNRARGLGLPGCLRTGAGCGSALERLHLDFHSIPPVTAALVAVPLLAGMFWAAPLVSREYETGTHRLAWTQSVSPLRWIITKITVIFAVLALGALTLGLLATWALDPLEPAFGGRFNSTWYDIQGVVPVACMLFALSAGVASSALIRRTIPAMAVTLVAYAAARIPIHVFRIHFAPIRTRTTAIQLTGLIQDPSGDPRDLGTALLGPGDWLQSVRITDTAGRSIATNGGNFGVLRHYCPALQPDEAGNVQVGGACRSTLTHATAHVTVRYQPSSHFWLIQSIEGTAFVLAAAALVVVTVLAVTRRRPI